MRPQNIMMDRPIIQADVLAFLRDCQRALPEPLRQLQAEANARRVPIIPYETAIFLDFLLAMLKPKQLLEVGTAIGYSAGLFTYGHPGRHLVTIERNPVMMTEALANIEALGLKEQVELCFGDAEEILPRLRETYDFIFLDSAKAKYVSFLPTCLDLLAPGGLLVLDDIFQGGSALREAGDLPRRARRMHEKLQELIADVAELAAYQPTYLPLGDGILLLRRPE